MVNRFRTLSFEEREVLGQRAPIVTNEKFKIREKFFVSGDLLPKSGKKAIDTVP